MVTDTQILNTVACYLLMHVAYRLKTKPVIIVRKAVISRFAVLNLSPFRSPKFLLQLFSFIKLLFSVVLRNEQKNWNTQQLLYSFSSLAERFSLTFCFVLFSIMKPMQEISAHLVFCLPISRRLSEYL